MRSARPVRRRPRARRSLYSGPRPGRRPGGTANTKSIPLLRFPPQGGKSRIVQRDKFELPVTQVSSPDAWHSRRPDLQYKFSWCLLWPSPLNQPGRAGSVVGRRRNGGGPIHGINSMDRRRYRRVVQRSRLTRSRRAVPPNSRQPCSVHHAPSSPYAGSSGAGRSCVQRELQQ